MTTMFALPPATDALRQAKDKRAAADRKATLALTRQVEPAVRGAIEAGRVDVSIGHNLPTHLQPMIEANLAACGYKATFHNGRGGHHLTISWEHADVPA